MWQAVGADYLKRSARLGAELGADIVKVNWSGDAASFAAIIRACERPVVLAGGTLISDEALLNRMEQAREAGAVGCSVGRNVFQHKQPQAMTHAIRPGVRDHWPARQALGEFAETAAAAGVVAAWAVEPV